MEKERSAHGFAKVTGTFGGIHMLRNATDHASIDLLIHMNGVINEILQIDVNIGSDTTPIEFLNGYLSEDDSYNMSRLNEGVSAGSLSYERNFGVNDNDFSHIDDISLYRLISKLAKQSTKIIAYGKIWRDKYTNNKIVYGIHDIHMNQYNSNQDGAIFFIFPNNQAQYLLFKFP